MVGGPRGLRVAAFAAGGAVRHGSSDEVEGRRQLMRLRMLQKETQKLRTRTAALKARREAMAAHQWQAGAPEPLLHDVALRRLAIAEEEDLRAKLRREALRKRMERHSGGMVAAASLQAALDADDDEALERVLAAMQQQEDSATHEPLHEESIDPEEVLPITEMGSSTPRNEEEARLARSPAVGVAAGHKKAVIQLKEMKPFKDRARVTVTSGGGGRGSISFASTAKKRRGPPSGGNGGDGGDVVVRVAERKSLHSIAKPAYRASPGVNGAANGRHGRRGETVVITVPPGTIVKRIVGQIGDREEEEVRAKRRITSLGNDGAGQEVAEEQGRDVQEEAIPGWLLGEPDVVSGEDDVGQEEDTSPLVTGGGDVQLAAAEQARLRKQFSSRGERIEVLATLDKPGDELVVAHGGKGGRGNMGFHHTRSRNKESFAERYACGSLGETAALELELKLMADVGLVGFPNAGKSTFLRVVSNATPKVASYAFTTLHPTVGMVEFDDRAQLSIADLPGLIEGAHANRGLGHQFLRHVERTKVLCFVLDMAGVDGRDPIDDWLRLVDELELYEPGLVASKQAVVAANKMDVAAAAANLTRLQRHVREEGGRSCPAVAIHGISTRKGQDLAGLLLHLRRLVTSADSDQQKLYG